MTGDDAIAFCLTLPGTRCDIQWAGSQVMKVGDKVFALVTSDGHLAFKCSDVSFRILTDRPGIVPAPYLARAMWVQLDRPDRLSDEDLLDYLRLGYGLVLRKLPKVLQAQITAQLAHPPTTEP